MWNGCQIKIGKKINEMIMIADLIRTENEKLKINFVVYT